MFVFLFCTQIAVADVYESAIELYVSFNPSPAASGAGGGGFSYNTTKFSVTADKYASIKSSGSSHASTSFASTKAVVTKQCIEERLVSKSETAVNCSSQQQEVHLFSVLNFIFSFEFNLLVIYIISFSRRKFESDLQIARVEKVCHFCCCGLRLRVNVIKVTPISLYVLLFVDEFTF